jgi:AcrR family transcriptional regulator
MKTARWKNENKKNRDKKLESALDIIIAKGLGGLTMRGIAKQTGMTAPNLYNYFSNKDEIYIHIVIRGFEMLYADLKAVCDFHDDKTRRLKAMIDTYMDFGINKPRYYDIMFTRPTPKYNDYVGTPLEKISEIEYKISMDIAALALNTASEVIGPSAGDEILTQRLVQIWSLMHGMITLHNSQVMGYVAQSPDKVYKKIIDEFIDSLAAQA